MPTHLWQHSLQHSLVHALPENRKILFLRPWRSQPLRQEKNGTNIPSQTWTLLTLVPDGSATVAPLQSSASWLARRRQLMFSRQMAPTKTKVHCQLRLVICCGRYMGCCPRAGTPQDWWTLSPRRQQTQNPFPSSATDGPRHQVMTQWTKLRCDFADIRATGS